MIEEFKGYLKIDKSALDDEIIQQPQLFFEVSEAYVEAVAVRDSKKEELAQIDAELDAKYRNSLEKATEGTIKAKIQTDKKHGTAFTAYINAKELADSLLALKEAFQQRGYMLRDLVSLHTANYYETSSARGTGQTEDFAYHRRRERLAAARERT